MKFSPRVASVVTLLTLTASVAPAVQAQALPSASDIIAKYVTAIGGKAEILKVTSYKQLGTMELPAMGISANVEIFAAAPNKTAMKTEIPGLGVMQTGYNGTVAWDVNPMQGPRLLANKELAQAIDNSDFFANMMFSPEHFSSMETVGDTTINGERACGVKMVRKATMKASTAFFSASSGLQIAGISTQEAQGGSAQVMSVMSDYKRFGALLVATRMESQMGPQKIVMTVREMILNGAPDAAFAVPEQVKPLIKP